MTQENTWFNAVPYSHNWGEEDRTPVEGIYHGKINIEGAHEQKFWVYLLRSERGFEKLEGRNQLDKAMELIPLGSRVRVTNLGLEPISGGMSERQFEVLISIENNPPEAFQFNSSDPLDIQGILTESGFNHEFSDDSP
jgi:hypothetical protein